MPALLEISNATKAFATPEGSTLVALDSVSLKVASSEFVTLLGPSGCGKTTLLRCISGFETLDQGDILIDGQAITQQPAYRRPVNTVFQNYALFPHLNVERNVAYALEVAGTAKEETRRRVGEMIELVGLAEFGSRAISQLSGGQQQRVALARALVARPKLLLLDEPLSALDKNLRQKMQQELKGLQAELDIGFIFVTHDQDEALTMSDRIAVLAGGRIQQLGTPQELYHRPANIFTADFLGESNLLSVTAANGVAQLEDGQQVPTSSKVGPKATLMIRPESFTPDTHENAIRLDGIVRERFYNGKDNQIFFEVPALGTLQALLRANVTMPDVGATTTLFAPHSATYVIAEDTV